LRKLHLRPPFGRLPRRAPPGGSSYRSHLLRGLAAGPVAIAPRTVQFPLAFGTPPCLGCRDCDVASPRVGLLSPVPLRSCDPDGSRTSTRGIISPPVGGGKIPPGRGVRGPPRGGPPGGPPGPPGAPRARARGPGARGPPGGAPGPASGLPPGDPWEGHFGGFSGARYTISSYSEGGILGGSGGVPGGYTRGGMVYHGGWILSQMAKKPKKPKIHFVPTGRVIKYPRKCTPPGPGGPPGGPPGPPDSLPPRTGIPQGVWFSPAHMVGSVSDPLTRGPLAPG